MTKVSELGNPSYEAIYSCSPREAVIAAYAQNRNDFNTWDYQKYDHLVVVGKHTIACGNFCTLIDMEDKNGS